MHVLPLFTRGNACPRCGSRTERVRTPFPLRFVRRLAPSSRRRLCLNPACAWVGFALARHDAEEPLEAASARR